MILKLYVGAASCHDVIDFNDSQSRQDAAPTCNPKVVLIMNN
jgi:hypothetical protein